MLMPMLWTNNYNDMDDWMNVFDREFNNMFAPVKEGRDPLYGKHAKNLMKTDVRETENTYEVDVDLPGFKKEEIHVDFKDGYLTVAAKKEVDKDEKEKESGKLIRQERYSGDLERSFYVGDGITAEEIKASFENGVLRLSVPKKAKEVKKPVTSIEVH